MYRVAPSKTATTKPLVYTEGTTVPPSTEEDIFAAYPSTEDVSTNCDTQMTAVGSIIDDSNDLILF